MLPINYSHYLKSVIYSGELTDITTTDISNSWTILSMNGSIHKGIEFNWRVGVRMIVSLKVLFTKLLAP